jgi:methylamine dehydrogenase accessory protein MauD
MDHGPKVGEPSPVFRLPALNGENLAIGQPKDRSQLLFFLSPTCPVCKKLLPILRALRTAERRTIDVVLASDGERSEHLDFIEREGLSSFTYVLSADLGMTFRIGKLPYAVLIGPDGHIDAKGLVNNREQIESLLTAQEMGMGSLQDYLEVSRQPIEPAVTQEI